MEFKHPDERRAYEWLRDWARGEGLLAQDADIPPDLWRRILAEQGPPMGQSWWMKEAKAMVRVALSGSRPSRRLRVLEERVVEEEGGKALPSPEAVLRGLARLAPEWAAAAAEALERVGCAGASEAPGPVTVADVLRRDLFGASTPPLPSDCGVDDVLRYLEQLAQRPRQQSPAQVAVRVASYLWPVLVGAIVRFAYAGRLLQVSPGSALAEALEASYLIAFLMGLSPHEVLDYLLTGSRPYGLPWFVLREHGVLVGGPPTALVAWGLQDGRLWAAVAEEFEKVRRRESANWGTGRPLELWNALFASETGKAFRTEIALYQFLRRIRLGRAH